ncbi:MAG: hypothetical protein HOE90_11660 [Bacteriovoracaceae bacterium]|nr:hypothetical protein [Bacteriovoracaceae bacterium]
MDLNELRNFGDKLLDLLTGPYAGINLTRILDPDEFFNKQILDSVKPLVESELFQNVLRGTNTVVDVGFGGGFPLLPLAYLYPEVNFIGFEARNKKVKTVSQIAGELGLKNVFLHHQRLEEVKFDMPAIVTLKAVGKVGDFLPKISTTKDLTVFFFKGPNFLEQEKEGLSIIESKWKLIEESCVDIPGTEKRLLLAFKPKNVPCGTFGKNLKKLSQFVPRRT